MPVFWALPTCALTLHARFLFSGPHLSVLRDHRHYEAAFAGSGYWDHVLLRTWDLAYRAVFGLTLVPLSESGWSERTAGITRRLHAALSGLSAGWQAPSSLESFFRAILAFAFIAGFSVSGLAVLAVLA